MSDQKKPADSSSTEELDAEELENVAGGLEPASQDSAFKFFRPNPTGDGVKSPPTETVSFVFHKID